MKRKQHHIALFSLFVFFFSSTGTSFALPASLLMVHKGHEVFVNHKINRIQIVFSHSSPHHPYEITQNHAHEHDVPDQLISALTPGDFAHTDHIIDLPVYKAKRLNPAAFIPAAPDFTRETGVPPARLKRPAPLKHRAFFQSEQTLCALCSTILLI